MPSLWITRGSELGAHASGGTNQDLTKPRYTKKKKGNETGGVNIYREQTFLRSKYLNDEAVALCTYKIIIILCDFGIKGRLNSSNRAASNMRSLFVSSRSLFFCKK